MHRASYKNARPEGAKQTASSSATETWEHSSGAWKKLAESGQTLLCFSLTAQRVRQTKLSTSVGIQWSASAEMFYGRQAHGFFGLISLEDDRTNEDRSEKQNNRYNENCYDFVLDILPASKSSKCRCRIRDGRNFCLSDRLASGGGLIMRLVFMSNSQIPHNAQYVVRVDLKRLLLLFVV